MFYGLDLHWRFIQVCCIDGGGQKQKEFRADVTREAIAAFAERLGPGDAVVMEATFHTWVVWSLLAPRAGRIVVANPLQVKAIAPYFAALGGPSPVGAMSEISRYVKIGALEFLSAPTRVSAPPAQGAGVSRGGRTDGRRRSAALRTTSSHEGAARRRSPANAHGRRVLRERSHAPRASRAASPRDAR